MITLDINDLQVDSFPTGEGGFITAPTTTNEEEFGPLFMPITAHTDPCDECCKLQ